MKRVMTMDEWSAKVEEHRNTPLYDEFMGYSPGGAAVELGVNRQRIHQLTNEGKLDIIHCTDRRGRVVAYIITDASIRRRKLAVGKPRDLLAEAR